MADAQAQALQSADFRALFEASPTPLIVVAPPDWTIVAANDARLAVTSTTRAEQIGRRLFEAFPDDPDDPNADGVRNLTASLERVVATRSTDTMAVQRYAVRGPDGGFVERWWAPVNKPVLGADGEVALIIHHVEDVTEVVRLRGDAEGRDQLARAQQVLIDRLRASEAAIRESEARRNAALSVARLGTFEWEPESGAVALDSRSREIFGFSSDEVLTASRIFGRLHPDDLPRVQAASAAATAAGQHLALDYRIVLPSGETRTLLSRGGSVLGGDGRTERMVGVFADISDQKRAETELRESEARYRTLFENIEAAFCVVEVIFDDDGRPCDHRFIEINPAFERQSGLKGALGRRAREILPEHEQHWFDIYGEIVKTGVPARFENGSEALGKWFDVHAIRVGQPEQHRVAILFNDITERKKAEDSLRELNETLEQRIAAGLAERKLLAELVEGTDAFVQVADNDYRWLAINRAAVDEFERIYGVRPKVGDSMLELLGDRPEHREAVKAVWGRVLAGEEFTEVGEFGDPGRERRSYEMKYHVLRDVNGEGVGAYQFVYDVTARVAEQRRLADAEAARRQADALYRAYFENTAEALFVVGVLSDGGFTIQDLNPAHQAGIGLPIDEVRGKRIDEVLPAELAEQISGYYRRVVASREVLQYRETFNLNGSPTYWDTVLVPVPGADGRIESLIGSSRDLTRQQAAEEQLRQTQKMDAMGQLTGGVAHDFNNLLTPIIGSLDMLMRRGVGNERERRLIDGALQSADRAKTLVQRLLAFARRQPLQPSAVDLAALVQGMAGLIDSTLGPTIDVKVDLADDLPPAKADPNQLEMALLNLAVNARDAMPDGGVLTIEGKRESVRAGHRTRLRPGHYMVMCVTDTGVGMDEATRARAIEPFFSTKGIGKGTGLGLSMVHGLAAQLDGALMIDSAPGRGTTIEFWLPVSLVPIDEEEASAVQLKSRPHRGKALLVDDEELVRMSTADMLMDLGFEVTEAGSAEEALRLVQERGAPDLLVTDHLMPGMSGADLARELRARSRSLPVLIVSGYAEAEGIAPDLPRLTKPFRNSELAERIASLNL